VVRQQRLRLRQQHPARHRHRHGGAYALARLKFLGRAFMSSAVLITYLVPPAILFIPLYAQIRTLGLADSLGGLIVAYPSSPFRS
jgi:ABC-type sugar transport system, permease component